MKNLHFVVIITSSSLLASLASAAETPDTLSLDAPWRCTAGAPISTADASEGLGAMRMQTPGYSLCTSTAFSCDEITTSDQILIDVKLPSSLPNPYWVGDVALYAEVPSAGLYNAWVGMSILTGLPQGEWTTISIAPTPAMLAALSGSCSDAVFKFSLNTSAPNVLIDNIRFQSEGFSMLMSIEEDADDGQFDPSFVAIPSGWSTVGEGDGGLYSGSYQISDWGGLGSGLTTSSYRFTLGSEIPAGSTVVEAWLSLYGLGEWNWNSSSDALTIGLEFSDDAAVIDGIADLPGTPSGRDLLSTTARWPESGGLAWQNGWNDSVNLAPLLQELVDTYGGLPAGAHVQFFVRGDEADHNGEVLIEDSAYVTDNAPTLTVFIE